MNIGLLSILHNKKWDFRPDMAQTFANALRNAIELQLDNDIEKQHGYFLSKKGYRKEGKAIGANFEDKLYVGNIERILAHQRRYLVYDPYIFHSLTTNVNS